MTRRKPWEYRPYSCGAVQRTETLFERYVQVCSRDPHDDRLHHDGDDGFFSYPNEEHASMYTCNAIRKEGKSVWFCTQPLRHDGDHQDGSMTWAQENFDDEDVPPVW